MSRNRIYLGLAVLFTVVNVAGIPMAMRLGEGPHAALHVALAIVGGYVTWRLALRGRRRAAAAGVPATEDRIDYLQQSVDAVAIEVERLGEAQRWQAKLDAERAAEQAKPSGKAQP